MMITREQLSQLLQEVDAKALADQAGVSVKTVYRLRAMKNAPRLDMVEKLLAAVKDLKKRR